MPKTPNADISYAHGTDGFSREAGYMLEKEIEKILVAEVAKAGGRAYKWVSPGNAGVPDRIVILPGRAPVFMELKADTGSLTALQESQLNRLRGLGQKPRVVYGLRGLAEFFFTAGLPEAGERVRKILTRGETKNRRG